MCEEGELGGVGVQEACAVEGAEEAAEFGVEEGRVVGVFLVGAD